ncbi:unnamed protein product [Penicillium nalgiovense]|uniref:Receptor L-domain domain-containing protein n=1 Tax=Penicillium nalgiovense TaxID=60175 RepID=A0A9W4ISV5_PENNA|nr:unnamed protein product [Penicillium nalgiovense]CAG7945509.1 unnamed protein product [Penicillium nalgiovense]CAG7951095.1 unnamed protein product [Penicillium nalgiovense]CAG7962041.1 unnamed protein product [Penicillium nalgiovense]CAG7978204.1 unnamed protein product [Penicillium nalgiovense]
MIVIYLLVIASAWQRAVADSAVCSSSVTISSQSDANNLRSCDTVSGSITISPSVSGAITINNVEEIQGALIAEGASGLTGLFTPDLDSVQGGITLSNLDSLTTITMGGLSQVSSSIIIMGNPKLKTLGFQDLEQVDGQLELTGSFDSLSLPSLDQVKGQTTIMGSSSMSCSTLDSLKSDKVFRNGYTCSSGSSGLSPGAKGGIAVGVIVVVLLIVLVLWFVLRRRRQKRRAGGTQSTIPPSSTPSTVVAHYEKVPISQGSISPQEEAPRPEVPPTLLPRKPVGSAILLDGRSVYEAADGLTPVQEYHELDAGPVSGSHQRPIHAA